MKRRLLITLSITGTCAAGVVCGELLLRLPAFRDAIGILLGRGHLLAFAQGEGIYEADLQRAVAELRHATGVDEKDRHTENTEKHLLLERLISNATARSLAAREKISRTKIKNELDFLRWQFPNEKAWRTARSASGLSARSLRRWMGHDLRARRWIGRQITAQSGTTEDECRHFYDNHPESFMQPERFRASHLFLAAPPETPPEVIATKQQAIKSFAERIKRGEKLADLTAIESEDEATKNRGGDLGFFSEFRMPPDFFPAVAKMRIGEISQPIRTRLGFHIIQLTDLKPARQMTFEEAWPEISLMIENEKRQTALQDLTADLSRRAEFVRNRF
jgi:parvulin-like peptidyl-prolyl isomerase